MLADKFLPLWRQTLSYGTDPTGNAQNDDKVESFGAKSSSEMLTTWCQLGCQFDRLD